MEKKRELVLQSDVDELIDGIVGVLLSAMSAMPAQCAGWRFADAPPS
jgi:small ligand-binding sensory domain FIST